MKERNEKRIVKLRRKLEKRQIRERDRQTERERERQMASETERDRERAKLFVILIP